MQACANVLYVADNIYVMTYLTGNIQSVKQIRMKYNIKKQIKSIETETAIL